MAAEQNTRPIFQQADGFLVMDFFFFYWDASNMSAHSLYTSWRGNVWKGRERFQDFLNILVGVNEHTALDEANHRVEEPRKTKRFTSDFDSGKFTDI